MTINIQRIPGDLYAALWRNTAGRPWTYVMREASSNNKGWAWALVILTMTAEVIALRFYHQWYAIALELFYPFLLGHLYWDTAGAYIKPRRYK